MPEAAANARANEAPLRPTSHPGGASGGPGLICLLEDYGHSRAHDRDTLLLACAHHTAGHQKFGDPLEAYRRFTEALG